MSFVYRGLFISGIIAFNPLSSAQNNSYTELSCILVGGESFFISAHSETAILRSATSSGKDTLTRTRTAPRTPNGVDYNNYHNMDIQLSIPSTLVKQQATSGAIQIFTNGNRMQARCYRRSRTQNIKK